MVGIKHPIIQAGMGPYSTNRLAVAAANAGALGILSTSGFLYTAAGGGTMERFAALIQQLTGGEEGTPIEHLKRVCRRTLEETRGSKGIFGINCMVSAEMTQWARVVLQAVIEAREEDRDMKDRLRVIITSAGDPLPWTDTIKPSGVKWFHVVPSVRHAKRCERAGVDVVIASGHEGGMHIAWEPVHTMVLLPAVVKALGIPVVGAGGFGDGASLAAALALGAVGVQMGTRFLATKESDFTQLHKEHIVKSGERDTLVARGVVGPARYLKNQASIELARVTVSKAPGLYLGEPDDLTTVASEVMDKENEGFYALYSGDEPRALIPGGEIAGRIDDVPTVQELVERIIREAEEIIRSLPKKLTKG
jgi:NAD(P)H-dependent flavin oxidoreductase YrpB (nitropropane dioxygenase family)